MKLPQALSEINEWTLVGPMGPRLSGPLSSHSILAVDGGASFTSKPLAWLGDSDSYQGVPECPNIFQYPSEKADSDLGLALKLFEKKMPYRLHLWGFLGGRSDHELFNLGECLSYLVGHPTSEIRFYRAQKLHFILFGTGIHHFTHHGLFSLGSLHKAKVTLQGDCHYPILESTELAPLSSFGLSNIGNGEIVLNNQGPVFIYFPESK